MANSAAFSPRKGKARAQGTEEEFYDIAPVITYRHILSKNLGVRSPLRVVALCDSDAFYAACERVRLGIDPELPLVVQQWDALIAVNYPARKFGISRMDKIKEAKKRCPELVVVHVATYREGDAEPSYWDNPDTLTHKVSLDHYRRESAKIIGVFKEIIPDAEIEKASIDEAFVDFSVPVQNILLERHPYLAQPPEEGLDAPLPPAPGINWTDLGALVPVTPTAEDDKGEGSSTPPPEPAPTWHDVALSIGAELMAKVRHEVLTRLGYTMSAGISRNKFLAKLSASYKKPNSQSILRNAAIPYYLRPMPFQKIRFLGGKLGKALEQEYDASTVGDLLLDEMQRKFGEESVWVYEVLRGVDRSEVKEKSVLNKSMLASKNLPHPVTKPSDGIHWLKVLAAELALRLREARENTPGLWPKTIVVRVSQTWAASRSKQCPFPFAREVTAELVAGFGEKLWREMVGTDAQQVEWKETGGKGMKVTHIGLAFAGVEALDAGQRGIEGFFAAKGTPSFAAPKDADGVPCARCGARISQTDEARQEHDDWHFARELARGMEPGPPPPSSDAKRKAPASGDGRPGKKAKSATGIAKYFSKK